MSPVGRGRLLRLVHLHPGRDEHLISATREDLVSSLSLVLRFAGRKRVHHVDNFMARIAAEHLADHLARSGFVVSKRPPVGDPCPGQRGHGQQHPPERMRHPRPAGVGVLSTRGLRTAQFAGNGSRRQAM